MATKRTKDITWSVNETGRLVGYEVGNQAGPGGPIMVDGAGNMTAPSGDLIYAPPQTLVGGQVTPLPLGNSEWLSAANGATSAMFSVPDSGGGSFRVRNGDRKSDTACYLYHRQQAVRMSKAATNITLPNLTLDDGNANTGWIVGLRVRIATLNGTTSPLRFMRVGAGAGYFSLGYEGSAAANPNCLRATSPNAAGTGLSAVRSNASPEPTFAPFGASFIGQYMWVFMMKTNDAGISENYLSPSTGLPTLTARPANSISLAYCPDLAPDAAGTLVYGGSVNIAKANFSGVAATPIIVGPDLDTTGAFDISDIVIAHSMPTQAQLVEIAKGKRNQEVGVASVAGTDKAFEFISLTAAELLDRCGGAAATSVTMTGGDGLTPSASLAKTLQYIGNTGSTKLDGYFLNGVGYPDVNA